MVHKMCIVVTEAIKNDPRLHPRYRFYYFVNSCYQNSDTILYYVTLYAINLSIYLVV